MTIDLDGEERTATAAVVLQEIHEIRYRQIVYGHQAGRRWIRMRLEDGGVHLGLLREPEPDLKLHARSLHAWDDPSPPKELLDEPLVEGFLTSRTKRV